MRKYLLIGLGLLLGGSAMAQNNDEDLKKMLDSEQSLKKHEKVYATFKSTRMINGHSNETLKKHDLDFRVDHRFGDIGGANGGMKTFFGLDNSTDIRIGFEYGITDRLMAGFARNKGATEVRQIWEGFLKYKLLEQTKDNHMPLAVTVLGNICASGMESTYNTNPESAAAFQDFAQRLTYFTQVMAARKFNNRFSAVLSGSYIHRNLVSYGDMNDMFAVGAGARFMFTKRMGITLDWFHTFRTQESKDIMLATKGLKFYDPIGIGFEIETGGHVFHINFTNATAITENQMLPLTTTNWLDGEFRWGFNISRTFTLF